MSTTITIRLDDDLAEMLDQVAAGKRQTKSDVIRRALRGQLSNELLDLVRESLVPRAEELGLYTDEDVFAWLKRDPETGALGCFGPEDDESPTGNRRERSGGTVISGSDVSSNPEAMQSATEDP
jgi:predicted transcriptional regulator